MWRHFAGRDFPLEGFCKRLFPAEGFVRGGILPQSHLVPLPPHLILFFSFGRSQKTCNEYGALS